jgi:hypothetical protein
VLTQRVLVDPKTKRLFNYRDMRELFTLTDAGLGMDTETASLHPEGAVDVSGKGGGGSSGQLAAAGSSSSASSSRSSGSGAGSARASGNPATPAAPGASSGDDDDVRLETSALRSASAIVAAQPYHDPDGGRGRSKGRRRNAAGAGSDSASDSGSSSDAAAEGGGGRSGKARPAAAGGGESQTAVLQALYQQGGLAGVFSHDVVELGSVPAHERPAIRAHAERVARLALRALEPTMTTTGLPVAPRVAGAAAAKVRARSDAAAAGAANSASSSSAPALLPPPAASADSKAARRAAKAARKAEKAERKRARKEERRLRRHAGASDPSAPAAAGGSRKRDRSTASPDGLIDLQWCAVQRRRGWRRQCCGGPSGVSVRSPPGTCAWSGRRRSCGCAAARRRSATQGAALRRLRRAGAHRASIQRAPATATACCTCRRARPLGVRFACCSGQLRAAQCRSRRDMLLAGAADAFLRAPANPTAAVAAGTVHASGRCSLRYHICPRVL